MRRTMVLAALGLGVVGALLPATSASAVCIHLPTGHCVTPCAASAWNKVADTANPVLGELSEAELGEMHCLM